MLELSRPFTAATIKAALLTSFLKRSNREDWKKFSGQGLFHAEFLPNRRKLFQQRVYKSYLWLLSKNLIRRLAVFASKVTNVDAAYYSWKKLNKPSEHYFLKRKHLKNHWKRIKPIWIQMRRENCSYQLRSQPRRSTSTVKWIYNPK